ncbi:MAG: transketolase [Mycoplasma sp.]|nr:transketolase [Mycoplasma sp.]
MIKSEFDKKAIGAIRYIGLKAIQCAKGGHIGMTISAAPITYTLFTKFIKINPKDGKWINRDRFVLSGGHGSMSMYPIFYLSGIYNRKDIENFKVENSKTPGHPEYENKKDNFIDASTGPLGQGFAMGVGMAIAQKHAENKLKRKFPKLFTNYTYVLCGDGDLQEGISYEAMAIAGKYNLNKLIVLHDSNKFQLDSSVETVSIENLKMRFESNNWFYIKCSNDPKDIEKSILKAQKSKKPSFIEVETIIAEGLSVGDTDKGHHGIVSDEELEKFKKYHGLNFKGWNIDKDIFDYFKKNVSNRGTNEFNKWEKIYKEYKKKDDFKEIDKIIRNNFDYKKLFDNVKIETNNLATRVYLKNFLSALENTNPFAIATCADLANSTNVIIGKKTLLEGGQTLPIGIREFAMSAVINGITSYGAGFKAIGGTFLVFSDYMKSAIRVGALMEVPSIYIFTHDSYLVGGDGPTHQPYDQLAMLRAIQNVYVYRPADEEELRHSMILSYSSHKESSMIILSRQNIKSINKKVSLEDVEKGAYIVKDCKNPNYAIAASGAEVQLALSVANDMKDVRVISVPCLDKVANLSTKEKEKLFKVKKTLLTIEPSSDYKWYTLHLPNQNNIHLGAYTFGKSMDGDKLYADKGFNKDNIIKLLKS